MEQWDSWPSSSSANFKWVFPLCDSPSLPPPRTNKASPPACRRIPPILGFLPRWCPPIQHILSPHQHALSLHPRTHCLRVRHFRRHPRTPLPHRPRRRQRPLLPLCSWQQSSLGHPNILSYLLGQSKVQTRALLYREVQ
jgi:hypothetical protein